MMTNKTRAVEAFLATPGWKVDRLPHDVLKVRHETMMRGVILAPAARGAFGPLYSIGSIKNILERIVQ